MSRISNPRDILLRPVVSEKSYGLLDEGTYTFVVAPDARLADGLFDYLHAGPLSRWEVLRYMPRLARGGRLPAAHPNVWLGRCREVRLSSEAPLTVHLDGEFFCLAEDGVRNLDIRILPAALRVHRPGLPEPGLAAQRVEL